MAIKMNSRAAKLIESHESEESENEESENEMSGSEEENEAEAENSNEQSDENEVEGSDSDDKSSENSEEDESDADNEVSEDDDDVNDEPGLINPGWADSISKILKSNKPKNKKTLVLSKAKKITDVRRQKLKPAGFQVATNDGEVREEKVADLQQKDDGEPARKKKRELPNLRVKPNILEKDRERTLAKIATKGVVHLFNSVKMQQKDISEKLKEAGPLDVRKEKALKSIDKRAFLDVLMGEKSQNVDLSCNVSSGTKNEKEPESKRTWSVLRDDFMMSAKMKDWDKELEQESEGEQEVNMESD